MPAPPAIRLRPATRDEVRLASDLETRARPDEPIDPPSLLHQLEHPRMGPVHLHLVLRDGTPIGTATHSHPEGAAWEPERVAHLNLVLVPGAEAAGPEVLRLIEERALADRPRRIGAWSMGSETYLNEALANAGFLHVRSGITQDLDLAANRERLLGLREKTRARIAAQGLPLRSAAGQPRGPFVEQLRHLTNETQQDIPHTVTEPDMDAAGFEAMAGAPSFHLDRVWTAWDGAELVAVSYLDFPVERGNVWTGYTACHRAYRGRGLAQAVKNESVGQAIELGVGRIRTDNDSENAAMLAINRKLGYAPVDSFWEWLKTLEEEAS